MENNTLTGWLSPNQYWITTKHRLRVLSLFVKRDLKVKYRGSFFGYLWSMINPLLSMLILTLVFSNLVKDTPNYHIYVLSGILSWSFASTSISLGANSIISGSALIRKVHIPVWTFPVVSTLSSAIHFCFSLVPFLIVMLFSRADISPKIFLFPVIFVLYFIFVLGISLQISVFNVFFRDVGHVIEPVLAIVFYATPIVYQRSHLTLNSNVSDLLALNPFVHFFEAIRSCLYQGTQIEPAKILLLFFLACSSLVLGILVHRRWSSTVSYRL